MPQSRTGVPSCVPPALYFLHCYTLSSKSHHWLDTRSTIETLKALKCQASQRPIVFEYSECTWVFLYLIFSIWWQWHLLTKLAVVCALITCTCYFYCSWGLFSPSYVVLILMHLLGYSHPDRHQLDFSIFLWCYKWCFLGPRSRQWDVSNGP